MCTKAASKHLCDLDRSYYPQNITYEIAKQHIEAIAVTLTTIKPIKQNYVPDTKEVMVVEQIVQKQFNTV